MGGKISHDLEGSGGADDGPNIPIDFLRSFHRALTLNSAMITILSLTIVW